MPKKILGTTIIIACVSGIIAGIKFLLISGVASAIELSKADKFVTSDFIITGMELSLFVLSIVFIIELLFFGCNMLDTAEKKDTSIYID